MIQYVTVPILPKKRSRQYTTAFNQGRGSGFNDFVDPDPDSKSGSRIQIRNRDPGSRFGIWIPDPDQETGENEVKYRTF
jgi:hypothetical protein